MSIISLDLLAEWSAPKLFPWPQRDGVGDGGEVERKCTTIRLYCSP